MATPSVRLHYARLPHQATPSPLASSVAGLRALAGAAPLTLARSPAGTAHGVLSGLLELGSGASLASNTRQLRSIECVGVELLTLAYDSSGRLASAAYADDARVEYVWEGSYLRELRHADDESVSFEYDAHGWLRSAHYPSGVAFVFDHDGSGRLMECGLPDGGVARIRYARDGRPSESWCAGLETSFVWGSAGTLERTVTGLGERLILDSDSAGVELELTPVETPSSAGATLVSALGLWTFSGAGRLVGFVSPWSGYTRIVETAHDGRSERRQWSFQGQVLYESDSASGRLASTVHPDGSRTMLHPLPGGRNALAVHPDGVQLLAYDRGERLSALRDAAGGYLLVSVDSAGRPARLQTAQGRTRLRYDAEGRLRDVELPQSSCARFRYGDDPWPRSVELGGSGARIHATADALLGALWFLHTFPAWRAPLRPKPVS